LESLRLVKEVRQYEELIFDQYRNNDITLRVKGKMKFEHLSEVENINYIKYNTIAYDEIMNIWDNAQKTMTPNIANALIQKVTVFYLTSRTMNPKKNYDIAMLNVLKDNRYKAILRYLINNIQHLSNKDFSLFLWSVGKLHFKECGLIHMNLFEVFKEKALDQISYRLDQLTPPELAYLSEGLLLLSGTEINLQLEEDYPDLADRIIVCYEKHIKALNENPNAVEFNEHSVKVLQNLCLYLADKRTDKALSLLEEFTVTLQRNIKLFKEPWVNNTPYIY